MDKIQAAIAKARATRSGSDRAQPINRRSAERVSEHDAIAEAWKMLPTCAPNAKRMARQRIVTFDTTQAVTQGAVAFDLLRTKILQKMRANGWKRLAVTSPTAGCGKSTVVLNLAFSFSKLPDLHTVVADLDMRLPSLAATMGFTGSTGFSSVLAGDVDFAQVATRPRPNLAMGVNYSPTRNPAELLQGPKIGPVLADIETRYNPTLTLFDTPPMLVNDDTIAFMGHVDCVLLVAAAEATSLREIDVCERELAAQTNVLGVVLNKCRYTEQNRGYDAYG